MLKDIRLAVQIPMGLEVYDMSFRDSVQTVTTYSRSGRKRGNLIGKFLYAMMMLPGKNNAHN